MCSCTLLQMPAAQVRISIPHISMDLRSELLCLALSKKGEKNLKKLKEVVEKRNQGDPLKFTPKLIHGCPFWNHMNSIQLPMVPINNGDEE